MVERMMIDTRRFNARQIRNWVAVVVLIPVAVVVYPAWALYHMARFIWIGCDEMWAEGQKP